MGTPPWLNRGLSLEVASAFCPQPALQLQLSLRENRRKGLGRRKGLSHFAHGVGYAESEIAERKWELVASSGRLADPWPGTEGIAVIGNEMAQVRKAVALRHVDLARRIAGMQQCQTCTLEMSKP